MSSIVRPSMFFLGRAGSVLTLLFAPIVFRVFKDPLDLPIQRRLSKTLVERVVLGRTRLDGVGCGTKGN